MSLSFQSFGAAQEVTGSKHLFDLGGLRVLCDCGMFQGHREEADRKKVLKIPMRRMQTMDKQVGMAERLLADLLLFVQQEDQALRAKTQARAKATEKGMTFADREAIYKTM